MQAFPTMRDLLDSARLGQYVRPFMEQGFDDVEYLVYTLSRSESKMDFLVQQTGLKPGHLLKLQTALSNLRETRGVSPETLLMPAPSSPPVPVSSASLRVPASSSCASSISGPPPHLSPSHMFGERESTSNTSPRPPLHPSPSYQFPSTVVQAPPRPHPSLPPARTSSPLHIISNSDDFSPKPLEARKPREAHSRSRSVDKQHTPDSLYEAMNPFSAALQLELLPPATHSRPTSKAGTPVPGSPSLMASSSSAPSPLSLSSPAQNGASTTVPAPINEGDYEEEDEEEERGGEEEEEQEDSSNEQEQDAEEHEQQQQQQQQQRQDREKGTGKERYLSLPSPVKTASGSVTPPTMKSPSPSPSLGKVGPYTRPSNDSRASGQRYQRSDQPLEIQQRPMTFEELDRVLTNNLILAQEQLEREMKAAAADGAFAPNPRALPFDPPAATITITHNSNSGNESSLSNNNNSNSYLALPPSHYHPPPYSHPSHPSHHMPHYPPPHHMHPHHMHAQQHPGAHANGGNVKSSPYMFAAGMSSGGPAPVLPYSSPHFPSPLPPFRHSFSYQRPQYNQHQSHPFQLRPGQYLAPENAETVMIVRTPVDVEAENDEAVKKKKKKKMSGGIKQCTMEYFCKDRLDCKLMHRKDEMAFFRNPQTKTRLCTKDLGSVCDKTAETCAFAHGVADARCSKCHRRGHLAVDCGETKTKICRKKNGQICDQDADECSFAHSSADARCSGCKQRGHFISECPSPPTPELSKTQLKKKLRAQKQAEGKKKDGVDKETKQSEKKDKLPTIQQNSSTSTVSTTATTTSTTNTIAPSVSTKKSAVAVGSSVNSATTASV